MTRRSQADDYRQIPSVDRVLRHPPVRTMCEAHGRTRVRDWIRGVLESIREADTLMSESATNNGLLDTIAERIGAIAGEDARSGLRPVINGTGVLLQTNLGRAPLAQSAIDAISHAARCCNVEVDLDSGRRGKRGVAVEDKWRELTGADAALVVNNCAAATLLTLRTFARGREVILSRGQLIEIGGSYRLPDVFAEADVTLREVGTTNRTHLADYEQALSDETRAVLRVHASNFRQIGFTHAVPAEELAGLAHAHALPLIDDIGSGCVYDLGKYGWHNEPTIGGSLRAGADLVLFSGDKLLGGPQCGVILGRGDLIEQIRTSPLTRALRVDKLTLAALEATLRIYLAGRAFEEIPVLRAIAQSMEQLHERAEHLRRQLGEGAAAKSVGVESLESVPGGGSLPGETLPSCGLVLRVPNCDDAARRLRLGTPSIMTRVHQGAVCIDLRTVVPDEDEALTAALARVLTDEQVAT